MAVDRVGPGKVRHPRKVLFDSSFLIAVMEHPTPWQGDILENVGGFEGVVLQPVFAELRRLAGRKGRQSRFAALALALVESGAIRLEPSEGTRADEELVSHALRDGAVVATIDGGLIRQLRASHVEVLSLRSGRVEKRQN
ncbi:MAG: PIN domain-containing protein [Nitrososphaerales archaeon]